SWTLTLTTAITVDGSYIFAASQTDAAGNTGNSGNKTITIDKTAPTVTLDQPTTPTNDNTPALSGLGGLATGDDTTVTIRIYSGSSVAGSALQTLSSVNVNQVTGAYSANATTLPDGTYTAQTSQSDSAGNTGTSTARTFRVDTTAPASAHDQPTTTVKDSTPSLSGLGGLATGDDTTVTIRIYSATSVAGSAPLSLHDALPI